jgi:iron complex transport system substrate-binding protein
VFVLKVNSYDDVLAAYTWLGEATGRQQQADDAANALKARVDAVVGKASSAASHPSVIIVTGAGRDVYGGGDQSYAGGLVKLLGATNALGALPAGAPIAGFGTVDLGQLASKNPDLVLAIPAAGSTLANDVRTSPAWAGTAAVKNGRVYELDPALFLKAPGPRIADAIEKLYSVLYP